MMAQGYGSFNTGCFSAISPIQVCVCGGGGVGEWVGECMRVCVCERLESRGSGQVALRERERGLTQ